MRFISCIVLCFALSACATDYASQLYQPNFGRRGMHYSESDVDPSMLMNGDYASKKMNGYYGSQAFCLTDARCSVTVQPSSSGWNP